jgi:aromatic ring-opening dioxygenase LigB subunit
MNAGIAMKADVSTGLCLAVLMPHAPVLIPEVGGGREREAGATVDAMWAAAREVVAAGPDALVLVSPHSPRRPGEFGLWSDSMLAGHMGRFGRPDITLKLPAAAGLRDELERQLSTAGIVTWSIRSPELDHGAFVPLYYLTRSGWDGPTVVMGLNHPGEGGLREVGEAVRRAAEETHLRLAVVASGDMSHRLTPGAPAGFDPQAPAFDHEFVRLVRAGRYADLEGIDPTLRELAAEDVVDSTLIAVHAAGLSSHGHEVLSYQGPFGVGYCVARLFETENDGAPPATPNALPAVAREAVARALHRTVPRIVIPEDPYYAQAAGVFVTLRNRDSELRGCRGTLAPRAANVVEETRSVALSSAFEDHRFQPVADVELDELSFEVSVLHAPEPVRSRGELDPQRFGVIITTRDGRPPCFSWSLGWFPALPDTACRRVRA